MNNIFSIDFGTMRTKAAYFDSKSGRMMLFRMGVDEKPYIPSLFYLATDGRRLFGDQAYDQLADDPLGLLTDPLKNNLREPVVRTGNRQKAKPADLIGQLISGILNQAESIPNFDANNLTHLILTVPVHFAEPDLQVLRQAAALAGFKQKQVEFIKEPVSAAQAWMQETGEEMDQIIVVDGGRY
jgi:molecular chaperone DnaK (HSP70)